TRPEAIKLAPLILELKKAPEFEINVCVTAQHRQMLDQVLKIFGIEPDVDLNIMKPNQSLAELSSRGILLLDKYVTDKKPDLVLVQGDTTTTFIASLAAFYNKIAVGHVEAGLRTYKKFAPFPEEINRMITSRLSDLHFTPTEGSKNNLLKEGVDNDKIFVTGNTVIDALFLMKKKLESRDYREAPVPGLKKEILNSKYILITGHRRENFGEGFKNICQAILELSMEFPDVNFIYPVHLNPNVQEPVNAILGNRINIHLIKPLDYLPFVKLMSNCYMILTDSGGIQEEAPSLGRPVLVLRDVTERPEAVDAKTVKIVGTNIKKIVFETSHLLRNKTDYNKMANAINPYGDGKAVERIIKIISSQNRKP
ncbi:MAG TPA: UDP-N-acetylglucosamine 2-epimerase (non-hydrolyzing), partial [Ignavibacteriaceae bacterium]|nr:UDP-N-acetylglucosamine 2-epimerase (non-hydrolyzing) [Ignavibacteriaceae bacterium]